MTQRIEEGNDTNMDRVHPNSRPNLIAALEVDQSYTESVRVSLDNTAKDDWLRAKTNLRNTLNKAASNAEKRLPGSEFTIEAGEFFTRSHDLMICVVVTRLK
jgi:hypothetical protein